MPSYQPTKFPLPLWTIASFAGWVLGVFILIGLSGALETCGITYMQFYIGTGMALGVSVCQWIVLYKTYRLSSAWIWTAIVGMSLPFILFDFSLQIGSIYKLPLSILAASLLASILQVSVLKRKFENAWLWLPGSMIAWCLSAATVLSMDYTMKLKHHGVNVLLIAILNFGLLFAGGIILGLFSGITFSKLKVKTM